MARLRGQAAAELGIDLARTVLVPDPGDHWLEVAAALVDVMGVLVLRPPARVDAKSASVLDARLRKRSSVLVVWGDWPRCEARLSLEDARWTGPDRGHGRLPVATGPGRRTPRQRAAGPGRPRLPRRGGARGAAGARGLAGRESLAGVGVRGSP